MHRGPFVIKFHVRDDQLEKGNQTRVPVTLSRPCDRNVVTSRDRAR